MHPVAAVWFVASRRHRKDLSAVPGCHRSRSQIREITCPSAGSPSKPRFSSDLSPAEDPAVNAGLAGQAVVRSRGALFRRVACGRAGSR